MISEKNILRHELTGLRVKIVDSRNETLNNVEGIVIDETKNMFRIRTKEKEIWVQKDIADFIFTIDDKKLRVKGSLLKARPEDRVKKKIPKKWDAL